jgi:predicted dehydrogenase
VAARLTNEGANHDDRLRHHRLGLHVGRTYAACLRHVPAGTWWRSGGPEHALAAEWGVPAVPDVAALLAHPGVDAVVITSPHTAHVEQALAAAAAGKHVYLEKPMAITVAECDAIIAACEAAGVQLTVNFVTRFRHAPVAAKRLVDEAPSVPSGWSR